jgi:hypothetical protein
MKKKGIIIIAVFVLGLLGMNNASAQVVVKVKPVNTKVVKVKKAPRPGINYIYIEGHWKWNKKLKSYVWIDGKWAKRPGNKIWVSGHWRKVARGWKWIPGHWA